MIYLRQSTASQEILLGPFVDATDGVTPETGLTISNTDIKIWKTGATTLADKNSGGATHISNGLYYAVLDATDTDTIGPVEIHVYESGALPVWRSAVVLDETVYDQMLGSTGFATSAGVAAAVWDATQASHVSAGSFGEIATEIASILVDTAEIGAAGAGLTAINLPDQTMNITGNLSGSVGSVTGAVGSVTGAVGSVTGNVGGNVAGSVGSVTGAVGSVTGNVGGNVTGSVGSLATQAKADVNAEVVDALSTDTYAEAGQGTPPATASLAAKIGYLYKNWRNRKTQTSTTWSLYNEDHSTVDQKATVADDGTTGSKTAVTTGP